MKDEGCSDPVTDSQSLSALSDPVIDVMQVMKCRNEVADADDKGWWWSRTDRVNSHTPEWKILPVKSFQQTLHT